MPAVALVFQETGGSDVELLFASDTRMLDEHNRRFALAEGPKKTRLLAEFSKPEVSAQDSFSRKLQTLSRAIEPTPASPRKRTLRAKSPAAEGTITPVTVHEHPSLLADAVSNARDRVLIICPWITDQVIDKPALASLEKLLKRNVRLFIGYGIDDDDRKKKKKIPDGLLQLASQYDNFELRDFGDTHEKVLIKDDEFVVEGSFNWLSFRGDPERKLRRERSLKVTDPAFVEKEFALFEARFRAKPKRARKAGEIE
jgi:phosphatidylserine/phosphatidylglycerophosphate/cardiolipin synthase-like enzyme